MSWSFKIANGDLQIGGAGLNTVTGQAKLIQDLSCDFLQPMGSDTMHPDYGSTIDGGIDTDGTYVQSVIGQLNDQATASLVGAEVQRVVESYQQSQITRNSADVTTYGKSTLTADEALLALSGVTVQQSQDQALVTATIQTGSGSLPLAVPFSTTSTS